MAEITLEDLIAEGNDIKSGIVYLPPRPNTSRTYKLYKLSDTAKYEKWKSKTIRFLSIYFPKDRCIKDFETASVGFSMSHYAPISFDKILGILESCSSFPTPCQIDTNESKTDNSIRISLNQSQQQSVAVSFFLEIIKDELKGSQLKELTDIAKNEPDPIKAKSKILEKVKSFGLDIASSIITNIITNPSVWSSLT